MRRRRIEDLLASNLRSDITENGSDFISNTTNVSNQSQWSCRSRSFVTSTLRQHSFNAIIDNVIFLNELRTVDWKQSSTSVVQKTKEMNISFGIRDPAFKRPLVIINTNELNEHLLHQEQDGSNERRTKQRLHDRNPTFLLLTIIQ